MNTPNNVRVESVYPPRPTPSHFNSPTLLVASESALREVWTAEKGFQILSALEDGKEDEYDR
jgi:hypothetical protein